MENQNKLTTVLYDLNEAFQAVTEEEVKKAGEDLPEQQPGEIELGDAPEEVKKLLVLVEKANKELEPLEEAHEKFHNGNGFLELEDEEEHNELLKKIHPVEDLRNIYREIMSRSARLSFGYPLEDIQLRKDWKIVSVPQKKHSGIEVIGIGIGGPDGISLAKLLGKR